MSPETLVKIEAALDAWMPGTRLESWTKLKGGISAIPYLLSLRFPNGAAGKATARFIGEYAKSTGFDTARNQFRILQFVRAAGLPTPEALFLPQVNEGEDPFFLMSYLEGEPTAAPIRPDEYVKDFAEQLALIHRTSLTSEMQELLPKPVTPWRHWRSELTSHLREPEVVEALLKWNFQQINPNVLRHGDFWPGNVLCLEGKITGVIDWEECCLGDPLADLAISRLDIWWILGQDASEEFTRRYFEFNPINASELAYWDLRVSLRPMENLEEWAGSYPPLGRPDVTYETMSRDLLEFIEIALRSAKS